MKQIITVLLFVFITVLQAQTKIYKIKEYYNRKDSLAAFFKSLDYTYRSDTVCVVFMMPGSCPRCEGTIDPFIADLKKYRPRMDAVSFVFNNNKPASKEYMIAQKFRTDKDFFLNKDFIHTNFKVSTNRLMSPFILLFNVRTGVLLNSEAMLGYTVSKENTLKFITEIKTAGELYDYGENTGIVKSKPLPGYDAAFKLQLTDSFNIPTGEFKIADVDFFDIKDAAVFKFTDGITHDVILFDTKINRLARIQPSKQEEHMFVKIPEDEFLGLKKMNLARSMYFKSAFVNDSVITISSSLPEIFYTKPYAITYNNKAGLIRKNIYTDSVYAFTNFKYHDSIFAISHPSASFFQTGDYIYVPVKKGWPSVGVDDKYLKNPVLNPFTEEFYEKTPVFAIFNKQGGFVAHAGRPNYRIRQARLGYLSSTPKLKLLNNCFYFTSGSDGVIYAAKDFELTNITDSISIYPDLKSFKYTSAADKDSQPMDYMLDIYNTYFQYRIMDFTTFNKMLYMTVKNDQTGTYYLYKYASATKKLTYTILDNKTDSEINDVKFFAPGNKELNLFTISSNDLHPRILKYKINESQ